MTWLFSVICFVLQTHHHIIGDEMTSRRGIALAYQVKIDLGNVEIPKVDAVWQTFESAL